MGKEKPPAKKYKYAREYWDKFLDATSPADNKKVKDIIYSVSKKTGIKPEILYSSAMEEGMQLFMKNGFTKDDVGYYIDGYSDLGLDNFATDYEKLKQYFPNNELHFDPINYTNEQGKQVKSGTFNTLEDALTAKAAYLRLTKDQVAKYATDNKIPLSEDASDFLSMAAYNGGSGAIPKLFTKYQKQNLLDQDKFISTEPTGGYDQNPIYYNTRKRYDSAKHLLEQGVFDDFYKPEPTTETAAINPPANVAQ